MSVLVMQYSKLVTIIRALFVSLYTVYMADVIGFNAPGEKNGFIINSFLSDSWL